jgi:hypothetical protein
VAGSACGNLPRCLEGSRVIRMVHDLSQDVAPPASLSSKSGEVQPRQAVAGLMPPQLGEALIRETWPSVRAMNGGIAGLAAKLMRSIILAPLGWLLLAPLFAHRFRPFFCRRYTLTNRRLMIRRGIKPSPVQEIPLMEIEDVRLVPGTLDSFYHAADLEVISKGQPAMKLPGVPEPESFRHAIINAVKAWAPGTIKGAWQPASAETKG